MTSQGGTSADWVVTRHLEARRYQQQGFLRKARRAYLELLAEEPSNFQFLASLGVVEAGLGDPKAAEVLYRQSLAAKEDQAWVYLNLSVLLRARGSLEEARTAIGRALEIKPDFAAAELERGALESLLGNFEQSRLAFEAASLALPCSFEARLGLAQALQNLGRPGDAVTEFNRAVALDDKSVEAYFGLGFCYAALNQTNPAIEALQSLLSLEAKHAEAFSLLSKLLCLKGDLMGAWVCCKQALALKPADSDALVARALVFRSEGRLEEALESLSAALAGTTQSGFALEQRARIQLLQGDYEAGWASSLQAFSSDSGAETKIRWPERPEEWSVSSLSVVHRGPPSELLVYSRFVRQLAKQASRVVLWVPEEQRMLAHWCLPGVEVESWKWGDPPVAEGIRLPLLGIPRILGLNNDSLVKFCAESVPVAASDRASMKADHRGQIALILTALPSEPGTLRMKIPLEALTPLFDLPYDYHLFADSLTTDEETFAASIQTLHCHRLEPLNPAQGAEHLSSMDLVIGVDSALTHLAAALGKMTWLLLPSAAGHLWGVNGSGTLWYPSMTLYRNRSATDWSATLSGVARTLPFIFYSLGRSEQLNRFVPDLKYDLSEYDDQGQLRFSLSEKLILAYLSRGFWLPLMGTLIERRGKKPGLESVSGSMDYILKGSSHPLLELACALPPILIILLALVPKGRASSIGHWFWRRGRLWLIVAALSDAALRLWMEGGSGFERITPLVWVDLGLLLHLVASERLKDVFCAGQIAAPPESS